MGRKEANGVGDSREEERVQPHCFFFFFRGNGRRGKQKCSGTLNVWECQKKRGR